MKEEEKRLKEEKDVSLCRKKVFVMDLSLNSLLTDVFLFPAPQS